MESYSRSDILRGCPDTCGKKDRVILPDMKRTADSFHIITAMYPTLSVES